MNVLIIDDDVGITNMMSQYFTLKKHQCTISNDGKEGIFKITHNSFDAVILDLAMPNFSGFNVLEELQKQNLLEINYIFILTAVNLSKDDESNLNKYKISGILKKPIGMSGLIKTLESNLEK